MSVKDLTDEELTAEMQRRARAKLDAEQAKRDAEKIEKERLKKEGAAGIALAVGRAYAAIKEAQAISDASGVEFRFSVDYGMGGNYVPNYGWQSSSSNC